MRKRTTKKSEKSTQEYLVNGSFDTILPDTSALIEGTLSKSLEKGVLSIKRIIIAEESVAELESQANKGLEKGVLGLEEIRRLREWAEKKKIPLEFKGQKPTWDLIRNANLGFIDHAIRALAEDDEVTLITGDRIQAKVAEAKGIKVILYKPETPALSFEKFFDQETMSIHLKEGVVPKAKRGRPGEWRFETISDEKLTQDDLKEFAKEVIEVANSRDDSFIEIERNGSTVAQLGRYRIVITKPPFSDGYEITAVRPVKHLSISDYSLSEKLLSRLNDHAEGILISGAPGHGKSTFAQALAEFYLSKNKVIKTVEAPRDLVLPEEATQYSMNHGSPEEIHDVLLLSRPDYTIYDEMRNSSDFSLFADMRLSGVGMIGVIHATKSIDAIQRFIGRIELGVIPHVVDTVIFIKDGAVNKVFSVRMVVKVPSGMTESDLARPVVEVHDFESGKLEFEIYTYGEQTVVIPVLEQGSSSKKSVHKMAEKVIKDYFRRYSKNVEVEMISDHKVKVYVPQSVKPAIIGKNGDNISAIEQELGLSIDVEAGGKRLFANKGVTDGEEIVNYGVRANKKSIIFSLESRFANKPVSFFDGDEFLLLAKASKKAQVKLAKSNAIARLIMDAYEKGRLRIKA